MSAPFQQQRAGKKRRSLFVLTWVASIVAALGIGLAGITKFAAAARWQELFAAWGFPLWFLPIVGALEIAGAVALLVPRLSLYGALVLGSVMIGAIGTLLIYPTPHFPVMLPMSYIILLIGISIARVRGRTEPSSPLPDGNSSLGALMVIALLIHAAGEKASVHSKQMSRDEAGRLGREKNRGTSELFRLTEAPHRRAHQ
jgi:uncharacterized membrane protein YphA (DoxX/SURF4 family)